MARGSERIHTRIVFTSAVLLASGCSLLFGLDDHQAGLGSGDEAGIDGDVPDQGNPGEGGGEQDGGSDAPPGDCQGAAFKNAKPIAGLENGANQYSARAINDGKTVYLSSERPVDGPKDAGSHIFTASRTDPLGSFGAVELPPGNVNSSGLQRHAIATDDDLRMFYIQVTGAALGQVWWAARDASTSEFISGGAISQLQGQTYSDVYATPNGDHLYVASTKGGKLDIYVSTLQGTTYSSPAAVGGINTNADDYAPVVSVDLKTMYFASTKSGQAQVYAAKGTNGTTFQNVTPVCGLGAPNESAYPTWLSSTGAILYYVKYTGTGGTRELWQAEIK